jgi:large subunit ribosomal protein L22
MGKQASERRLADNEAMAFASSIRTSARKLNLVAQSIRGLAAGKAIAELGFSRRRIAVEVKKVLAAAIANA